MFERFSEPARNVVVRAQHEAAALGGAEIRPEHVLAALAGESGSTASLVLDSAGVTADRVRALVEPEPGDAAQATGQAPFAPETRSVLELALREALARGSASIGTEHMLLGLLRLDDDECRRILEQLGADPERILQELAPGQPGEPIGTVELPAERYEPLRPPFAPEFGAVLDGLAGEVEDAVREGRIERAMAFRDRLRRLTAAAQRLEAEWRQGDSPGRVEPD